MTHTRPPRRRQVPLPAVPDVFDCLPALGRPQHVYIVGAGPGGKGQYDKIPASAYTMAANCMVAYPRAWSLWMAVDGSASWQTWWNEPVQPPTKVILTEGLVPKHPYCDYYVKAHWTVGAGWYPIRGCLFNGATIIGMLLQLAYFMGVRHATLVGCDLQGGQHHDGSWAYPNNGRWHQADNLQTIINWMHAKGGLRVDTMSPTVLKVPPFVGKLED